MAEKIAARAWFQIGHAPINTTTKHCHFRRRGGGVRLFFETPNASDNMRTGESHAEVK
jgi:hypothetical protein